MLQDQSSEEIVCENITPDIMASYEKQGFTRVFFEEVMSYDLSLELPRVELLNPVTYRTWDSQSNHEFFTVYQEAFRERPGFPGWSEEEWLNWTSEDAAFRADLSMIVLIDGQAVGFITNEEWEEESGGHIIQVGVVPRWRGRGLAAALITRSLHAWKNERKKIVIIHVNRNNPQAMQPYQRLGFVTIKLRGRFRRNSHG